MPELGHYFTDYGKERRQNEANKTGLALRDLGRLSVTQERDLDALVFLYVALMEKLFEQEHSPLDCDIERPCLCRDIRCMNCKFKKLLLCVELLLV